MRVRVLVADDHPVFRKGLVGVLAESLDVEVVGTAADCGEAVELAAQLRPDVVLMDLHMPGIGGVEATRVVTALSGVDVLVLTMRADDDSLFAATRAGARGYLVKGATGDEIVGAVRAVAAGEAVFGTDVAARILLTLAERPEHPRRERPFPMLSDRELEVLDLIAAGRRNPDIARVLVLSEKTVRNHVSNIFAKLGVTGRSETIVLGREAGLGQR